MTDVTYCQPNCFGSSGAVWCIEKILRAVIVGTNMVSIFLYLLSEESLVARFGSVQAQMSYASDQLSDGSY